MCFNDKQKADYTTRTEPLVIELFTAGTNTSSNIVIFRLLDSVGSFTSNA